MTFVIASTFSLTSMADELPTGESEQNIDLEVITVTATRTERRLMDSPLSSSVISSEQIQMSSADSLADLLRDVPGLEVTDAATAGMKRIKIRGEASRRVAILIDGQEVIDHSSYGAPLLLDPAMVERIEVIRGTGSVLYGQKALGGVVNFISKKGGDKSIQANISASYDSATQGTQYSASIYGAVGDFDYRLSASDNDHDNRDTPEGEIENSAFDNNSIMAYGAYNIDNHIIGLTYDQYNLVSEIASGIPNFILNMPQRDREKSAIFYQAEQLSEVLNKIRLDIYKQTIDRQFVQHTEMQLPMTPPMSADMIIDTHITENLETTGASGQADFILSNNHYLIAGMHYAKDEVNKKTQNQTEITMYMPDPMPPRVTETDKTHIEEASLTTSAVYIQDEWNVNKDWLITLGARHYWVDSKLISSTRGLLNTDSDDTQLVASFASNLAVSDNQNLRALISQGYGYPTLLQIAMGATAAGTYINPNSDLTAETSINYEIGYRFRNGNIVIDATAFYTDADDYLTRIKCADTQYQCVNPQRDDIYINADKATSNGLELDASIDFDSASMYTSMTVSKREQTVDGYTSDNTGLPSIYGKLGTKYFGEGNLLGNYWLDAYIRAASNADYQRAANENIEHYSGWGTLNLAFGSRFGQDDMMMLSFEAVNLTDKAYRPASEILLAVGRSFQAKFSIEF